MKTRRTCPCCPPFSGVYVREVSGGEPLPHPSLVHAMCATAPVTPEATIEDASGLTLAVVDATRSAEWVCTPVGCARVELETYRAARAS